MKLQLALSLLLGLAGCSGSASTKETTPPPASESTTTLSSGDPAPAFALQDPAGAEVTLASLTASGPAVLVFYRGDW